MPGWFLARWMRVLNFLFLVFRFVFLIYREGDQAANFMADIEVFFSSLLSFIASDVNIISFYRELR